MYSGLDEDGRPGEKSGLSKLSTLRQCHEVIDAQALQIAQLREQMALLQERLKLDSRNSSKLPSSDGSASGNRAQRRASACKRGAQQGHKGSFRAKLDESQVDSIVDCPPPPVCDCGEPVRHQVFDMPQVLARVDEYRLCSGRCTGCGKPQRAAARRCHPGVPSGQIGPRALALVGVLGARYHLTQQKTRDLLAQLMGVDFIVGAISQAHGLVAQALKAPLAEAAAILCNARVVHMDETHYTPETTRAGAWPAGCRAWCGAAWWSTASCPRGRVVVSTT